MHFLSQVLVATAAVIVISDYFFGDFPYEPSWPEDSYAGEYTETPVDDVNVTDQSDEFAVGTSNKDPAFARIEEIQPVEPTQDFAPGRDRAAEREEIKAEVENVLASLKLLKEL